MDWDAIKKDLEEAFAGTTSRTSEAGQIVCVYWLDAGNGHRINHSVF